MIQGTASVGHPVDVASGTQFTAWHDAEIQGIVPLVFRRYYSTRLLGSPKSILGRGWVHSFGMSLRRDVDGFTLVGPQGEQIHFDDPSATVERGGAVFNFGRFMELGREGDRFTVLHWHDWRTPVEEFVFDPRYHHEGRMLLQCIRTPAGHSLDVRYDDRARLSTVSQNVERRSLILFYNEKDLLAQLAFEAPLANTEVLAAYKYDERERLVAVQDAMGAEIQYEYDGDDRLIRETGRAGGTYWMKYDSAGRCVETSGADSYKLRRLSYDRPGRVTQVTDSLGGVTTYALNDSGQVKVKRLPNGAQETTEFDAHGRIVTRTGPSGETIKTLYDERGNVASITYPKGAVVRFEYDERHQITAIYLGNGGIWRWEYAAGAVSSLSDPMGARTAFVRDAQNIISTIRTSAGNTVSVSHDPDWTEQVYTDDYGLLISYRFDAALNIVEIADFRGVLNRMEYDSRGYLRAVVSADGARRELACDAAGSVLWSRSEAGSEHRFEYNAYSHRARFIDPGGFAYDYAWDTEGRVIGITNPKGEHATFLYDSVNNLSGIKYFDGRLEEYENDASGRRVSRRKADGTVLRFSYDLEGNLLGVEDESGELSSNKYDAFRQLVETTTAGGTVSFEYDLMGNCIAETQNGQRVESRYHPSGLLAARRVPGSPLTSLELSYDVRRRLRSIREERRDHVTYEYDSANLLMKRRFGSTSEELEYDVRRRLRSQRVTRLQGPDAIVVRTFEYDLENNLKRVSDRLRGMVEYNYDPSSHLIRSARSRTGSIEYEYDPCGNLIRKGAGTLLQYESGNRLVANGSTVFERDANGNVIVARGGGVTIRYAWNSFDQLVKVTGAQGTETTFGYDGLGRRLSRECQGVRTEYLWAGNDLVQEKTGNHSVSYLMGNFVGELLWDGAGMRAFIKSLPMRPLELANDRGSIVWAGEFDDWGLPQSAGDSNDPGTRLGLPGQYWDAAIQLYYNRFRYYSPRDGQFLSPDPIGLLGGLNQYCFGLNPINWVDALGLRCGQTHMKVTVNDDLKGQGGGPDPTRADWYAKQDAFNGGVEAKITAGTPLTIPTPAQYALDREAGNAEAAAARVAQGMGPSVQADHPVELKAGGGQGQALYPLASGVNGSVGSQVGRQAGQLPPGSPTPMFDLYDKQGNLVRPG